jgi:probable addiction module antidote protein
MPIELKSYDVAERLDSNDEIRHYLDAAFEDGDPAIIKNALANAARARGMSEIAKDAGITRAGLYRALSEDGNPTLETMLKLTRALGVRLAIAT